MSNHESAWDAGTSNVRRWRYGPPPEVGVWPDVVRTDFSSQADVVVAFFQLYHGTADTVATRGKPGQPDSAILSVAHYLELCAVAGERGYIARASSESFGYILRIVTGNYAHLDPARQALILRQVFAFLKQSGTGVAPFYTEALSSPELLRDIVLHESRYAPSIDTGTETLCSYSEGEIDAMVARQTLGLASCAPALIAQRTPPEIRQPIQERHATLAQQGIQVWAARLLNQGAMQEIYAQAHPGSKARFMSWEDTMAQGLRRLIANEHQRDVAQAIIDLQGTRRLLLDLGRDDRIQMIRDTRFDLDPATLRFIRRTTA